MVLKTLALFTVTAVAEILGCYLFHVWVRREASAWLLLPAVSSLVAFAWLLTLHPTLGAGRAYAAYGGVYAAVAVFWMWGIEGRSPDRWDVTGAAVALIGMSIIAFAPRDG